MINVTNGERVEGGTLYRDHGCRCTDLPDYNDWTIPWGSVYRCDCGKFWIKNPGPLGRWILVGR